MSLTLAELTVLLVEPSAMQRKALSKLLLQSGISYVHEATDGLRARSQDVPGNAKDPGDDLFSRGATP